MRSKYVGIISIGLMLLMAVGCSKDSSSVNFYKCLSCTSQPQGEAANDASSKGVYKGIVLGSSGTLVVTILNKGTDITSVLMLDDKTVNLSSGTTWIDGLPYIGSFSGSLDGKSVSLSFSVNEDGDNPMVLFASIPDHPDMSFIMMKEKSDALIECFEGNYYSTKPEEGTFNIILNRKNNTWNAMYKKYEGGVTNYLHGTITSDNKLLESEGTTIGTLSGDEIEGSFFDEEGRKITASGKRTL